MGKVMIIVAFWCVVATVGYGQDKKAPIDLKVMTARTAEKLEFSEEQKQALVTLNERYAGENYDRKAYRDEFRKIMTDEQRMKADEMRKKQSERNHKRK